MELADILERRRMVRSYLPEPIPREVVLRIVHDQLAHHHATAS